MSIEEKWDYFVININFEEQKSSPSDKVQKASEKLGGSLSKEFLEKEFPAQFKNNNNNSSLHPSKQLEIILKKIGDEGWKLQATEKVGTFLMFIFMKKKIKS